MGSKVSVVKLPKSGGVSQRQQQARQAARNECIFEYFNGPDRTLHPVTLTMEPEKLRVFRLGELAWAVATLQSYRHTCTRGTCAVLSLPWCGNSATMGRQAWGTVRAHRFATNVAIMTAVVVTFVCCLLLSCRLSTAAAQLSPPVGSSSSSSAPQGHTCAGDIRP